MSVSREQSAVLSRVALQVAHTYHRTHPWLSVEELQSEAWVAQLEALPNYDSEAGELGGYLYRVAARACKVMCWRLSVAANVPTRRATAQQVARLRTSVASEQEALSLPAGEAAADEALDTLQRGAVLSQLVAEHLAAGRHGEAAAAVLTGALKSREAAQQEGVPVAVIYEATKQLKRRILADARVQEVL